MVKVTMIALAALLLLDNLAAAQSYCAQVKEAVARYGYTAARRHALANYGREAVQAGDRCLRRR
jgi:hypothetical protein